MKEKNEWEKKIQKLSSTEFLSGFKKTDMCRAIEEIKQEYAEEYAKEYAEERDITSVKLLFENGGSLKLAIATFKSLSEEVITGIYEEYNKTKNMVNN